MESVSPELLKQTNLFSFLKLEELKDIAVLCKTEEFEPGSLVYQEGDRAEKIYLVREGRVAIEVEIRPGKRIPVYTETKGKMFGYPSLVKPHAFETYARCLDKVKLITLNADELVNRIFKEDCRRGYMVMNKLAEIIGQKLKETRQQLLSLVLG
jgi:CRP-like cAMP-binding protein